MVDYEPTPGKLLAFSNVSPRDPYTQPFRVVLRLGSRWGEFVTHLENMTEDGNGGFVSKTQPDYFWGHYFDNEKEAYKDFHTRAKKYSLSMPSLR